MKNSSDTIGNRTRELPACSTVPQPTAPPRTRVGQYIQLKRISSEIEFLIREITGKLLTFLLSCSLVYIIYTPHVSKKNLSS
jgi:hypothetical protein